MEEKQAASSASPRVLMQPYPRLVSWEQYKENVVSPSPARARPSVYPHVTLQCKLIFFLLKTYC